MPRSRPGAIHGQFAARTIEMLESPAYRALSLSAHRVISRVEIEQAHHGGKDNGRLPVTYDDFQAYGIDRHSIAAAIREAVALGFLEITEAGRAGNAEFRAPNIFRLTYRGTKRDDPTDEWRRVTRDNATAIAKAARKNRNPVGRNTRVSVGNPHRNHSGEIPTTARSGETPTTFDISGRGQPERSEGALPGGSTCPPLKGQSRCGERARPLDAAPHGRTGQNSENVTAFPALITPSRSPGEAIEADYKILEAKAARSDEER